MNHHINMDYFIAEDIGSALALLGARAGSPRPAKIVAGGTDLAVQIADGVLSPSVLVDISGIGALRGIEADGEGLSIGSAVSIALIAGSGEVPRCLRQGACAIGSPQIRNLGTIGGNICNASPCGDTLAPLLALDARLELRSSRGVRTVDSRDFFTGPKKTVLEAGELLTRVLIGKPFLGGGSAFRKIGKRNGQAISQVNVAVWVKTSGRDREIEDARVVFGSVAPTPLRLHGAETALRGERAPGGRIPGEPLARAVKSIAEEIKPIADVRASVEYRRMVAGALFRDALEDALTDRTGGASTG
jgi:carbon-monoxide dehydrogenase medium subunit